FHHLAAQQLLQVQILRHPVFHHQHLHIQKHQDLSEKIR
ncbi:hypothetical protein chiPu_0025235, partial [Chiloscyllium punctatum]|nr:hypothetical protein [Chiloscyllium punctatum]